MTAPAKPILSIVTGNPGKLREFAALLQDIASRYELQSQKFDLPEYQFIASEQVMLSKLSAAQGLSTIPSTLLVDDTSLAFGHPNGLPGALIKFFLAQYSLEQIVAMARSLYGPTPPAFAKVVLGVCDEQGNKSLHVGLKPGTLVDARGTYGFGWDAIFQPECAAKTFGEMQLDEKNQHSARSLAIQKLLSFMSAEKHEQPTASAFDPTHTGLIQSLCGMEVANAALDSLDEIEIATLSFDRPNNLPGALLPLFLQVLTPDQLFTLAQSVHGPHPKAIAQTILGKRLADGQKVVCVGETLGTLVAPQGHADAEHAWETLFVPDGAEQSLAALSKNDRQLHHPQKKAARQMQETLRTRGSMT